MYQAPRSRSFPSQAGATDAGSPLVSNFTGVAPIVVVPMVVPAVVVVVAPMIVAGSR